MKNLISSIQNFFFKPTDALPLSFFRISIGLFGLIQTLVLAPSWLNLYGVNGYVEWFIGHELFSLPQLPSIVNVANVLVPFGFADNTAVYIVTSLYVLSLLGLTVGWRTKWMCVLAWLSHFIICNTALEFSYGVETFMQIGLFYLMFSPCAEYLSLDAKAKRTGHKKVSEQARFMIRVFQIQLCLVYFDAGFSKMQGTDWLSGQAIWYVLGDTHYLPFNLHFLADIPLFSKGMSWWTLVIETCFPLFIFWKPTRFFWWVNILLLHIGIAFTMGLYMFAAIMILHNIVAFGSSIYPTGWKRIEYLAQMRIHKQIINLTQV